MKWKRYGRKRFIVLFEVPQGTHGTYDMWSIFIIEKLTVSFIISKEGSRHFIKMNTVRWIPDDMINISSFMTIGSGIQVLLR
jgi:hypothetical protein